MLALQDVKVVAFDCDGVLFDTEQSNRAYYNAVLKHLGFPGLTGEQFAYVHMHTVDESLAYLFKDSKLLNSLRNFPVIFLAVKQNPAAIQNGNCNQPDGYRKRVAG